MSRDYRHLSEAGITLGLDVDKGFARVCFAACHTDDSYNPKTGRYIVDTLFDTCAETQRALGLQSNVVRFPYEKDKPRKHVLGRLINYLADELGERVFFRKLHSMFMEGIVSLGTAARVAQEEGQENLYYEWKTILELLDSESLEVLAAIETEEEFYRLFFNWQGSTDCIMQRLRRFSRDVYTGKVKLIDQAPKTTGDKVAPRRPVPDKTTTRSVAAAPVSEYKTETTSVQAELKSSDNGEMVDGVLVAKGDKSPQTE